MTLNIKKKRPDEQKYAHHPSRLFNLATDCIVGPVKVVDLHGLGFALHDDRATMNEAEVRISIVRVL